MTQISQLFLYLNESYWLKFTKISYKSACGVDRSLRFLNIVRTLSGCDVNTILSQEMLEASLRLCCLVVVLISFLLFIKTDATPPEPEEPKFNAFTGTGRRLDGKPGRHSTGSIPVTTSATTSSSAQRPTGTPPAGSQRPSGKLVFGGGSSNGAGSAAAAKVC